LEKKTSKTRFLFKNKKKSKKFLHLWFPVTIFAAFDDKFAPLPETITATASVDEAIFTHL